MTPSRAPRERPNEYTAVEYTASFQYSEAEDGDTHDMFDAPAPGGHRDAPRAGAGGTPGAGAASPGPPISPWPPWS